jgi:hypothetical protein
MNGHVFQVFSESKNEKQFSKTYEMLGQYAAKELQYSGDLDSLFNNMGDIKKPTLKEPEDISPDATTIQKQISAEKVKVFVQRTLILENNLKAMYAVIWGQCSENMQNKVKTLEGFKEAQRDNDCVWLLKSIRQITYNFEDHKYLYSSLLEAELNYMTYKQSEHESVAVYLENFRARYEVFEHYGGSIGQHIASLKAVPGDKLMDKERLAISREKTLAHMFLRHSDPKRFDLLLTDLDNHYSRGNNQFPVTLQAAYTMLAEYKTPKTIPNRRQFIPDPTSSTSGTASTQTTKEKTDQSSTNDGMTFTQTTNAATTPLSTVKCYKCNKHGHYANHCPGADEVQLLQTSTVQNSNDNPTVDFSFHQEILADKNIPDDWILLDSQSTVSVFKNPHFLSNIRESDGILTVRTNGGTQVSKEVGAFFTTISRKIKFRTIAMLPDRSKSSILKQLNLVINLYHSRGFSIEDIHSDHEFECIRNDILPTQLNVVAADSHVGEIERSIRTIKERVRATIHGLPFRRYPRLMIRELVFAATKWLNQFSVEGGISDTMSPFTIMTGRPGIDYNKLQLEFGAYVQVFEDNNPTNTMKSRNTGAIALSHTGNAQGDYYFMSLETGKRLCRHAWTLLPMPNAVVSTVEAMATAENQPAVEGGIPLFEINPGIPLIDDDTIDVLDLQANVLDGPNDEPEFIADPHVPEHPFNIDHDNEIIAADPAHQEEVLQVENVDDIPLLVDDDVDAIFDEPDPPDHPVPEPGANVDDPDDNLDDFDAHSDH